MLLGYSLSLLLALTHTTCATSVVQVQDNLVRLPMAKRFNITGSGAILARDQARVRYLRARPTRLSGRAPGVDAVISTPATNQAVDYVVKVGIGNPPTEYSLLVDTGSSNTWVGAGKCYVHTSTTYSTGSTVSVKYGSGSFEGTEYVDTVSLGDNLTITTQGLGAARYFKGFDGVDGILGIGPVDLTVGTLSPDIRAAVPTVTDNLFTQGVISSNLVAISFEPTKSEEAVNGELTFGGTDSSKFVGPISFAPITRTEPASYFFGIDQSIKYGTSTSILSKTAGIVDTGTTLILIASDAFNKYVRATGGVEDKDTGLLRITPAQFANLKSLFFTIGSTTFELTPNAQIWPRALNTDIGGNANHVYLIVNSIGTPTGEGLDFINGMTFLERFYSVFDTQNKRVGLAKTPFTNSTIN